MINYQDEIDEIMSMINCLSFFEKTALLELSSKKEDKLIFFNPKNKELFLYKKEVVLINL